MKKLAQWSINNRVAVNLIMMFIIVAGLLTVTNMRRGNVPAVRPGHDQRLRTLSRRQPGGGGKRGSA
jgi:Cu/Ag efflux pump CusA